MVRSALALLALAAMAGCVRESGVSGDPEHTCGDSMQMTMDVEPSSEDVDILLVIDNSLSMAEEQEMLVESFPYLIRSLLDPPVSSATGFSDHVPVRSLHIGVVSTDMGTGGYSVETCSDPIDGDNGELLHEPSSYAEGCEPEYGPYLSSREDHEPSTAEWMSTAFGCIARLGIDGCGFEQQLKAARKALVDHRDRANVGFQRDWSILVVLFVTDEEDCSVAPGNEGIFDTLSTDLGHLGLRCFHHPYMLEPVDTYIDAFRSLREDPDKVLLGFIAGVPVDEACEGMGSEITGCLDHDSMQEQVDPRSMTRLAPSCMTTTGEAYPPRRMVEIAQAFGDNALVSSICTDDFLPAVQDLAEMIHAKTDGTSRLVPLPVERDPGDPGLCRASCTLYEMPSPEHCPVQEINYLECPGGCEVVVEDGVQRYRCEIPQVATRLADPSMECDEHGAVHVPGEGSGWVYLPNTSAGPRIFLANDTRLSPYSTTRLSCCFP